MPYHVEVRAQRRHARIFNLGVDELQRTVIEPWLRGPRLTLGDQVWDRRESRLRILDGPQLAATDLAHGRGWDRAERSSTDVSASLLREAARVRVAAVVAATPAAGQAVAAALRQLDVELADWSRVRSALITRARNGGPVVEPLPDVVVLAGGGHAPAEWLLDAGLALGALGPRAVLVQVGDGELPAPLHDAGVIRLEAGGEQLAERLRALAGTVS